MSLSLSDLDPRVRVAMIAELDDDLAGKGPYISPRLSPPGVELWPVLLRESFERGNDDTLALTVRRLLLDRENRVVKGKFISAKVPSNAHELLAEGEFNRYYARGLARLAVESGVTELEVYRAKPVTTPRLESERLIGHRIAPERLLADLRMNQGVDTALGVPAGPNSGLSVRIPADANRNTA